MRRWGVLTVGLLAMVALLALTSASALAATPISVTETTDAPLETGASTCESTDGAKGCTLRAAVELADHESGAVTIDVPEGTYPETASEPTLVIEADAEVTISGAGAEKTIIEGDASADVLEVEVDGSLTIDGVTVENGYEEDGGGIYVEFLAKLAVEDSTITENTATVDGGAIFGEFGSETVVKGSTITENIAGNGGGIYAEADAYVSVQESTITKNRAGESGGGIHSEPFAQVVVDKSTIAKNEADYEGGGVAAFMSEDICEDRAARHSSKRSAEVRPTTVENESEFDLSIDQSTIEHNSAEYGGGVFTYEEEAECIDAASKRAAEPQTALFLEPSLSIDQSTISYNRAEDRDDGGYGGGIYEEGRVEDPITNSTIADNFATNDGGGAAIARGASVALVSDTVFDNTVEPVVVEIQSKRVRPAINRDVLEDTTGPGNNLATEEEDAYVALRNTIVAESSASVENCEGNFESLKEKAGYNLDDPSKALAEGAPDSCGMSTAENDLVGVPPGLDEKAGLAGNGGPTQTIALVSTSPAIGFVPVAGDCDESEGGPSSVDQRGKPRPGIPGKGCDIGAYEYQEPPTVSPSPQEEPKKEEPKKEEPKKEVLSVKIVSPAQCASQRDITIHIQNVKQLGIVSAVVSIDGKDKRTLTGKHLTTAINLRGLPKGTFTVEIVASTRSGRTLKGKRVYHTCHTKLPGHSYLPL